MEIKELLEKSKSIWGDEKLNLSQIIVRTGKVFGDICRFERDAQKDKETHNDYEFKKRVG